MKRFRAMAEWKREAIRSGLIVIEANRKHDPALEWSFIAVNENDIAFGKFCRCHVRQNSHGYLK